METPTAIDQSTRKGQTTLQIICGDALTELRKLPAESVQCCVTSPPYWGLRDYDTAQWEGGEDGCDHIERNNGNKGNTTQSHVGRHHSCPRGCGAKRIDSQLGLEKTPEEYVAKMVEVFREVRRVMRKDGTCWINLGDSYWNGGGEKRDGGHGFVDGGKPKLEAAKGSLLQAKSQTRLGLKPKDLCGIPWRVAFALQADGWWLRSDIIWAKPNPMPESVTDRPTKAHEYLFLLTKSANYFYDSEAIREPHVEPWRGNGEREKGDTQRDSMVNYNARSLGVREYNPVGRNKRTVWTVATAPYAEAHFATYPPDLIKPCILAGTSAKGCCAKCGSPWERIVEVSYSNWAEGNNNGKRKGEIPKERMTFASGKRCDKDTKTVDWKPTCKCYKKICRKCCDVIGMTSDEEPITTGRRKKKVSVVQETIFRADGAKQVVFSPVQDNLGNKESASWEARQRSNENDEGIHAALPTEASGSKRGRVCDGTSGSDGKDSWSLLGLDRNSPSSERGSVGQSGREPSRDAESGSRPDAKEISVEGSTVSTLREMDIPDWICWNCGSPLEFDGPEIIPSTVLDCFAGSGTTGMVALELGRKAILIELNQKYIELIRQRCNVTPGLALA